MLPIVIDIFQHLIEIFRLILSLISYEAWIVIEIIRLLFAIALDLFWLLSSRQAIPTDVLLIIIDFHCIVFTFVFDRKEQ